MIEGSSPLFKMGSTHSLARVLGISHEDLLQLAQTAGSRYRPTARRAIAGQGKWRKIDDPKSKLKDVQTRIKDVLFGGLQFPVTMRGGIKKRGAASTAKMHVGQPEVLKVDLKNCFPKTPHTKVYNQLICIFGCSPDVARLITQLTTFHRMVPQGAPTSSAIVNLCLLPLHDALLHYSRGRNWVFTMWVDDIVISGSGMRSGIEDVVHLVQKHGYNLKLEKIQHMKDGEKVQEVLGYNVNRKVAVNSKRIDAIGKEILSFKGQPSIPSYRRNSLIGKINYVASAPSQKHRADKLKKLADAVLPTVISNKQRPNTEERLKIKHPSQIKAWHKIRKPKAF